MPSVHLGCGSRLHCVCHTIKVGGRRCGGASGKARGCQRRLQAAAGGRGVLVPGVGHLDLVPCPLLRSAHFKCTSKTEPWMYFTVDKTRLRTPNEPNYDQRQARDRHRRTRKPCEPHTHEFVKALVERGVPPARPSGAPAYTGIRRRPVKAGHTSVGRRRRRRGLRHVV